MRYLMATIALVTCPCHIPILVAVLGGTALGAALTEHMGIALAVLGVLFIASAWSAFHLFSRERGNTSRSER